MQVDLHRYVLLVAALCVTTPHSSPAENADSRAFVVGPAAVTSSGGVLCGHPDFDMIYTLSQPAVGFSQNAEFKLLAGLMIPRRITVLCPQPSEVPSEVARSPKKTELHVIEPNPSRGRISVQYDIAQAGEASVDVYDVQGRLVAKLVSGPHAPGIHMAHWEGVDVLGRTVGSGVYFCRLKTAGQAQTKRFVLIQ